MDKKSAIILLSGGVDSVTAMAYAKREGLRLHALSFDYGQVHRLELESAKWQAISMGAATHRIIAFNMRDIGGSALTGQMDIPLNRDIEKEGLEIPKTYVPARNTIFLSFALSLWEVTEAQYIYTGFNAVDYSGYPDCRPEYVRAFENMANLATKAAIEGKRSVEIQTPLINLTKGEIIQLGMTLGVNYAKTWSCYNPVNNNVPCGRCDSCQYRKKGFTEAAIVDPLI
ncbi:MAG: 7-cyano-7-deazaguanine synthase QueC [Candidatus Magnetoovum sp. WYHC-5]|nr:7-cyano-7-deazaguanine synthase QueC [Candidatus Magnetoovum sp. WYHC-5]